MIRGRKRPVMGWLAVGAIPLCVLAPAGIAGLAQRLGDPLSVLVRASGPLSMVGAAICGVLAVKCFERPGVCDHGPWRRDGRRNSVMILWNFELDVAALLTEEAAPMGPAIFRLREDIDRVTAGARTDYTMEDLERFVVSRPGVAIPADLSLRGTFMQVREALSEVLAVPRRAVRPSTRLKDLIGVKDRAGLWRSVGERVGVDLPPAKVRGVVETSLLAVLAIFGFLVGLVLLGFLQGWLAGWGTTMAGVVLSVVGVATVMWSVPRCARGLDKLGLAVREYPGGCRTVGDLVYLLSHEAGRKRIVPDEHMMRGKVRRLVRRYAGARWREVAAAARLVDLHIPLQAARRPIDDGTKE